MITLPPEKPGLLPTIFHRTVKKTAVCARAAAIALKRTSILAAAIFLMAGMIPQAAAQSENLLDRISNEKMVKFEGQLTNSINGAISRYVAPSQYVLSVKVIWNRDIIPAVTSPGIVPEKQKLPGFPIFVGSPGSISGEENIPPFVRMVVKVLLDETLPEYYERFLRKIVPIVARFDTARGDQVIVLKETFPVREKDLPPTLPESELMKQFEDPSKKFMGPPQQSFMSGAGFAGAQGQMPSGRRSVPRPNPVESAQVAYQEGRFTDALQMVQSAFQKSASNQQRSMYLGMEGSIYYTMKNRNGAGAAWKRALVFDPTNMEVQRALQFLNRVLKKKAQEANPQGGLSE